MGSERRQLPECLATGEMRRKRPFGRATRPARFEPSPQSKKGSGIRNLQNAYRFRAPSTRCAGSARAAAQFRWGTSRSSHCLPRIRKTILCACICTERRAWSSSARGLPTTGSRPCRPATCQTNVRASHPARANAARYARGRLSGGRGIGRRGRCRPPGEWRAGAAV